MEVTAFNCQAMAGMWLVRWQECAMTHIYFFGLSDSYVGTDVPTIWTARTHAYRKCMWYEVKLGKRGGMQTVP